MTVKEAKQELINALENIYDKDEASNITELIMEYITRWSRAEQIDNMDVPFSYTQKELLEDIIDRLLKHEPVQYIISEAWFAGMKFYVDKNVLIPRPETEELVDWLIRDCSKEARNFKILDIGTGSGCIAIAIKNKLPAVEMWACDVSDAALSVARMNADGLNAPIDFVPLDFLDNEQRKQLGFFDLVVANPPYVPQKDKDPMKKNVVDYEPHVAIFVSDDDQLIFYEAIADFGKEKLHEDGRIYLEIHESIGEQVIKLFRQKGYSSVELKKDMQGKDRMVKITK
jgi:release factor glutamine methyltransferase